MRTNLFVSPQTAEQQKQLHLNVHSRDIAYYFSSSNTDRHASCTELFAVCNLYTIAPLVVTKLNVQYNTALNNAMLLAAKAASIPLHHIDWLTIAILLDTVDDVNKVWMAQLVGRNLFFKEELIMETKIPEQYLERLMHSLGSLELKLKAADPDISTHLKESHAVIIAYPESVQLLKDSDIANLIKASELYTKVQITKQEAAKGTRKKLSADDI